MQFSEEQLLVQGIFAGLISLGVTYLCARLIGAVSMNFWQRLLSVLDDWIMVIAAVAMVVFSLAGVMHIQTADLSIRGSMFCMLIAFFGPFSIIFGVTTGSRYFT